MAESRKDSKGRKLRDGESERKDGRYSYRYTDVKTGKRCSVYAPDLPELREKEKLVAKDMEDGIRTGNTFKKMTLNELFERYMKTRCLSASTRTNYEHIWKSRVSTELGYMKIVHICQSDITAFYARLSNDGYSHSMIKYIHTMVSPALEMAVNDDIIRKNPARGALGDYGKAAKEKTVLTPEQQERLMDFTRRHSVYDVYAPMLTVMLETAVRCGELIGLTWADVDLKKRTVRIDHQLIYKDIDGGYGFHAVTPKTDAGVRVIPLTDKAYRAFTEQKKQNFQTGRHCTRDIDGYSDFVFLAKTGSPLMPSAVNSVLYNLVKAYNRKETETAEKEKRKPELLPAISAHSMRHTACTNMVQGGMGVKTVQYIMGHAHCNITLDVYSHVNGLSDVRAELDRYEAAVAG